MKATDSIEISVKGEWIRVPALKLGGQTIFVNGRILRLAAIHDEDWLTSELEDPEICIKELKGLRGIRADVFTFTQKPPSNHPKYQYRTEWDSLAIAHFQSFNEWWERLPQETRKNVRRSQKRGVVVAIREFDDALVRGLVELNNDCPIRQGRRYTHYGKTFDQVKRDYGSFQDRSDYICAYHESELIGFLKLVHRGEVSSIINLIAKTGHYDKRPANALLAKAVELCAVRGVTDLIYGDFNYGNKGESSIREFKTRNGFEEVRMPRFYVPLSRWGALCMEMKLHRGHLAILPRSVLQFGAGVRAKWYSVKQQLSRCSSTIERSNRNRQMECSSPPAGSNPRTVSAINETDGSSSL